MTSVPEHIRQEIYQRVKGDLEPPIGVVYAKTGVAVLAGGGLSLFLCGQLGMGLSSIAVTVNQWIMQAGGVVGCTALCGSLFALVPVVVLRALCSPMQFRAIVRKEWQAMALWILVFGVALALWNSSPNPLWEIFVWTLAATISFALLARSLDRVTVLLYSFSAKLAGP